MENPPITESETQRAINVNKGAGPDRLLYKDLQTVSTYITPILFYFFFKLKDSWLLALPQLQMDPASQIQTNSYTSFLRLLFAKCM